MTTMTRPDHNLPSGFSDLRPLDSGLSILFLAALPLLLWVFQGSFTGIATGLAMIWLLSVALRLIAAGQRIHRDYDLARDARSPRLPRKILGSALLGLVAFVLAGHRFDALLLPIACGVLATALSLTAFGTDPLIDKASPGAEPSRDDTETRQAQTLDDRLLAVSDLLDPLADAELLRRAEALRLSVARQLAAAFGQEHRFDRVLALSDRIAVLLETETPRLLTAQGSPGYSFARRRFLAKVETLSETFDSRALKLAGPSRTDAFDEEARRLLDRMPRESAA